MYKLTAIYKESKGGSLRHMTGEYKTKKAFKEDIQGNGLVCVAILTSAQIEAARQVDAELENDKVSEYVQQVM